VNNSGAAAINACPTGPLRCLWRPSSLLKVSNTPNVLGESLSAYQLIVVGSFLTNSRAFSNCHGVFLAGLGFEAGEKS
jgi:hypothetical protein